MRVIRFLFYVVCSCMMASCIHMSDADIEAMVGPLDGRPRSYIQTEEGWRFLLGRAAENVSKGKDIIAMKERFAPKAEKTFNDHINELSQWWCKSFGQLQGFPKKMMPHGSAEELAFMEVALYVQLADAVSGRQSYSLFFCYQEEPTFNNLFPVGSMLEKFIMCREDSVFIVKGNPFFNMIESLVAMAQGKKLFVLADEWSALGLLSAHGKAYMGGCELLEHDFNHELRISKSMMALDMWCFGLHASFAAKALEVIGKHWVSEGLELLFTSFGVLHEWDLGEALCDKSEDPLSVKIERTLKGSWWVPDNGLHGMLDALFVKQEQHEPTYYERSQYLQSWERKLLRYVGTVLPFFDHTIRQQDICNMLEQGWGFPVQVNRESQKKLAKAVVCKICDLEHISPRKRCQILDFIDNTKYEPKKVLRFFNVIEHPVPLIHYIDSYSVAMFPLPDSICNPLCTRAERLLFLQGVIRDIDFRWVHCYFKNGFIVG